MSITLKSGVWSSLGQTMSALIGNSSLGIKAVCASVLVGYGLSYSETAVEALSVTPGYFLPPHFYLWTALTHCYLEIHWWEVVVDLVTLILVGKLLEPLWGALEMVTFFVIVNGGVAVVSALFYYFLYMVTSREMLLFDVHIHGLAGYLAGVSVAVKQAMPDHILWRSPMGKMTNRNIPLSVFGLSFVMWAVGLVEGSYCTMFGSGLVISWIYLRFYQMHANGSRGDAADGFAFASFFPNVLQPAAAVVGNAIFSILVKIRLCRRTVRRYDVGGGTLGGAGGPGGVRASSGGGGGPSISISLPGVDNHDTERRRQIALKALSDRLNKATNPASNPDHKTAWPTPMAPSAQDHDDQEPLISKQNDKEKTEESKAGMEEEDHDAVLVEIPDDSATNESPGNAPHLQQV